MAQATGQPGAIAVIDDHRLFAHGLAGLLSELGRVRVFHAIDEALVALERAPAELVLLDYYVPGGNAPETITTLLETGRAARVVVVSASISPRDRAASQAAGAFAFATKHMAPDALLALCRNALDDRLGPDASTAPSTTSAETAQSLGLTERQLDVLAMLSHGYGNREIAELLEIGPETVKAHLRAVFKCLGASSRTEAVTLARDNGVL